MHNRIDLHPTCTTVPKLLLTDLEHYDGKIGISPGIQRDPQTHTCQDDHDIFDYYQYNNLRFRHARPLMQVAQFDVGEFSGLLPNITVFKWQE